jgi:hypothetical protein
MAEGAGSRHIENIRGARDILIALALLLFVGGWLFAYFYYQDFGIRLSELQEPIYNYYLYSLLPLSYIVLHQAYIVPFIITLIVLYVELPRCETLILVFGSVILAIWVAQASWWSAHSEAACTRFGHGNSTIRLTFSRDYRNLASQEENGDLRALISASDTNLALLIAKSPTNYYLLYQPTLESSEMPRRLYGGAVFAVPISAVQLGRVGMPTFPRKHDTIPWAGGCDEVQ